MLNPAPEIRYFTAKDGYRFALRLWEMPDAVANVVCLHGIVSHGGWYLPSGTHLARQGFSVHMLDRRGSGINPEGRGDVDRWETWLDDVEHYLEQLPSDVPRILLGISWGGMLAAAVARRRPDLLAGVGLLCPGLYSKKAANAVQRGLLRLAGAVGLRRMRVTIPLQDPALFSDNEQHKAYVATDPISLRKITIGFALANLELERYATEAPEEIRVPALVMLAEKDPITDNSQVRQFAERIGHEDKRTIEYPEASHTLEFEPDPTQYFEDLTAWCRRVARKASGS